MSNVLRFAPIQTKPNLIAQKSSSLIKSVLQFLKLLLFSFLRDTGGEVFVQ